MEVALQMIKVRQPKPKKHIRRRSTMRTGSSFLPQNPSPLAAVMNHSLTSPAAPDDDEKLVPFVDMLFGGRLTSILVCQECKHISHTYEDFNDLSLSIKPEDYAKERKRDKLKNLAKKFRLSTGSGSEGIRASSVPASPRKTVDEGSLDEVPAEEPRRRSADYEDAAEPEPRSGDVEAVATTTETSVGIAEEGGESIADSELELLEERDHVEFVQPLKIEKKPKDDDGWAKLGRKISMSVRFPPKDKDGRRRSRSRGRPPDIIAKGRNSEDSAASLSATSLNSTPMSSPKPPNASVASPTPLSPTPLREPAGLKADAPRAVSLSPALLANAPTSPDIVPISPPLPALSRFPPISRVVSPSIASGSKQPPSPRPPKATAEEAAYLRQILADIIPASNPFGIFKPSGAAGAAISSTATNLLMKMGQLPGIEECLRMFTAVEVLDKENMVGCRRCWKITNGVYRPRVQQSGEDSDDSDENEKSEEKPSVNAFTTPAPAVVEEIGVDVEGPSPPSSPSASASSSIASGDGLSDSTYDTPQSSLSNEVSLPRKQTEQLNITSPLTTLEPNSPTYGGMPIPIISTTAPESSLPVLSTRKSPSPLRKPFFKDHSGLAEVLAAPLPIRDSLRAPRVTKHKRIPGYIDSADESSDDGADSDASGGTSIFSDTSSLASRVHSSNVSLEQLPPPAVTIPTSPAALSVPAKVSRPKQVIMRAAYKRYLIATPPPVLVINLKRFQQVLKSPMISFSSGFKKLDDFVAFPELLDLAPFLAPKKEDFGLGKSGKVKFKSKNAGTCIYRLYAVVVHIGNMASASPLLRLTMQAYVCLITARRSLCGIYCTSYCGSRRSARHNARDHIPT